jgi:hypothetical protein
MRMNMKENGGEDRELPQWLSSTLVPGMRQGLIVVNDPREAEAVVQFFTAMIIDKDPLRVTDWRREYVNVSNEEFQEELKLLAMPLVHKMSVMRAIELPDGREYPVVMRKVYILLLAPPVGLIIFGQPSIALIVNDTNRVYFGYRGVDIDSGNKITVTIKSKVPGHVAVPFTPAIARFIFIGDVVEGMIDDSGQVRGLRK